MPQLFRSTPINIHTGEVAEPRPVVVAERSRAEALGDYDAVMVAIYDGDEAAIERLTAQHAQRSAPRSLSLSRHRSGPVFATNPGRDNNPRVMAARLAALGRPAARRPLAIVKLGKDPVATPAADAGIKEALGWLAEMNPDFAKMPLDEQHARAEALLEALAQVAEIVAASRGASTEPVLLLSAHAGRNPVEQAISALRASDPSFSKLAWESQVRAASELLRFFHGRTI